MCTSPPTVHTIPISHATDHIVTFKDTGSTTQNYNTQDTPHQLGIIEKALTSMGILETGATGLFITTRDNKISGLPTLGLSNKMIVVVENTKTHTSNNTRLP